MSTIQLSIITATQGSTQKRLIPGPDGRPIKDTDHDLGIYAGQVEPVEVDSLAAFADVLAGLKSNQALTLGVTGSTVPQELVTKRKLAAMGHQGGRIVARSLEYFSWPEGCFAILLDHDPEPGHPDLSAEQLWARLCSIMPEFAAAGRVVTVSSSSAIYDKATGECLKPASGHHTYIVVKGDVERFKAILEARCWLHGEAFFKLATQNTRTGVAAVLERFIVDRAVFSPERLVYEAPADIDSSAPFEQRKPAPQVFKGDYIDLDSIPNLPPGQQAQAEANRRQALEAIRPQRLGQVVEHITKEQPKLSPGEAKREARQRISQCDRGHLSPDHRLFLADGRTITAGDIGPEHHGLTLRDPQEPDYRGGAVNSIIYADDPGGWLIHSQAHGGKNYYLNRSTGTPPAPAPVDRRRGRDETANLQAYRERKQAQKAQEQAQWLADVAKLAGAPAGADRAAIAAAFRQRSQLSGPVEVGTFPELSLPMAGQRSLVLLDGQKMTRKTSSGLRSVVAQALGQGLKVALYVPTRVLARALQAELKRLLGHSSSDNQIATVDRWMNQQAADQDETRIIIVCPESAYKLADFGPDIVCFDEANESIPRVQSGQLGLYPTESRATIKQQVSEARMVAMAQEGLYRPTVAAVQRWGQFDPSQVQIIRRRRVPTEMTVNLYLDTTGDDAEGWDGLPHEKKRGTAIPGFYTWFNDLAKAEQDAPVIVPCGAEGRLRAMDRVLKQEYPDHKSQVLDGRYTPSGVRKAFADAPQEFAPANGLDRMGFSPTFDSGVSIEGQYFGAQFEYARAFETASAASQRGERYRDAIKGDRLTERHIYISAHGLPAMPPVEVFTANYWRSLLSSTTPDDAINLAKQMGCDELAARLDHDAPDDWAELPEFMAIAAQETFFKVELLRQEWEANGWAVVEAPQDMAAVERWSDQFYGVRQGIIEQQSRILAKAKGQKVEEITGAIAAAKQHKWSLGEMLGHEYHRLKDAEFLEAWVVAAGDRSLHQLQVRALVRMAYERPDQWAELSQQFALATLAHGRVEDLPALPCSPRQFEQARLLKDAPGLYPAIAGNVAAWTNRDILTRDAAHWARQNAKALGRLSQHNQRIHGLQFTAKTPAIKCFHKLLAMVGLEGHYTGRQGSGARAHCYRLKTADDLAPALEKAVQQGRPHDVQRQRYRLQTDSEVYSTLEAVLQGRLAENADRWAEVAHELRREYGASRISAGKDLITEVLDGGYIPPGVLVSKVGVRGWRGPIVEIHPGDRALVHWFGDTSPSLEPLDALELAA